MRPVASLLAWCAPVQGAGTSSVRDLAPELPFDPARRGYAVGAVVLDAVLPPSPGPTVVVMIEGDQGLAKASIDGEGVAVPEIRKREVFSRLVKLTENPLRRLVLARHGPSPHTLVSAPSAAGAVTPRDVCGSSGRVATFRSDAS